MFDDTYDYDRNPKAYEYGGDKWTPDPWRVATDPKPRHIRMAYMEGKLADVIRINEAATYRELQERKLDPRKKHWSFKHITLPYHPPVGFYPGKPDRKDLWVVARKIAMNVANPWLAYYRYPMAWKEAHAKAWGWNDARNRPKPIPKLPAGYFAKPKPIPKLPAGYFQKKPIAPKLKPVAIFKTRPDRVFKRRIVGGQHVVLPPSARVNLLAALERKRAREEAEDEYAFHDTVELADGRYVDVEDAPWFDALGE